MISNLAIDRSKRERVLKMMYWLSILGLSILLVSCTTQAPSPQAADSAADTQLGLVQEEEVDDASEAFEEIEKEQLREQKHLLERQITDPLFDSTDASTEV